jgi:hypothetical protein
LANRVNDGVNRVRTCPGAGAVAFLTLSLFLASFSYGDEPSTHHFGIAAQSLSSALNEFARQSQQQILFAPDLVAQKRSSPILGDMQPIPALRLLLKDSGLVFKAMSNGVILIGDTNVLSADATPTEVARTDLSHPDSGSDAKSSLNALTVEGKRGRGALRREVRNYVSNITTRPFPDLVARWQKDRPICPHVGGLPHDDSEYVRTGLSRIATAAGAPLAPEHCKPNFLVIVTSVPDELIEAWNKRNPGDLGSHPKAEVYRFMNATGPIRAFYNPGIWPLDCIYRSPHQNPKDMSCDRRDPVQDGVLASVIVLVDARTTKGVNFGQVTAYIAMAGLAQIRLDGNFGDAPTILQLFSDSRKAPPLGLSPWDQAYLKAVYLTERSDKTQRLSIAISMVHEIAP